MSKGIIRTVICIMAIMPGLSCAQPPVASNPVNALVFPEQEWDQNLLKFLADARPGYIDANTDFAVAPPPLNDSEETLDELDRLRLYARERRTPETLAKIEAQRYIDIPEGPMTSELIKKLEAQRTLFSLDPATTNNPETRKAVFEFIDKTFFDLNYFMLLEKKRFARPWPSQLASDLDTVIPLPQYPSYPSEYAADSRFTARVFGYVDPARAEQYEKKAAQIALRFEIAGLHYPSDTKAGTAMADEFFDLLLQNPDARNEIDALKARIAKEGTVV